MRSVWVLSMCCIQEGGGDVMPAELFASEQDALDRVDHYQKADEYWGCVDWDLTEKPLPIESEEAEDV